MALAVPAQEITVRWLQLFNLSFVQCVIFFRHWPGRDKMVLLKIINVRGRDQRAA